MFKYIKNKIFAIKKVISRHYNIASLGYDFLEKIKIFCYINFSYVIYPCSRKCKFIFKSKQFNILFNGDKNEYKIFYEIFIAEEYKISKKTNPNTIVDLGSNVGYVSIYYSCCYPESKIFSFEPSKNTFLKLKNNINDFDNIKIFNFALYKKTTKFNFYINDLSSISNSIINRGGGYKKQNALGINQIDLFKKIEASNIDILKFDIEGAEIFLIEDKTLLDKSKIILGEIHRDLIGQKKSEHLEYYIKKNREFSIVKDSGRRIVFSAF